MLIMIREHRRVAQAEQLAALASHVVTNAAAAAAAKTTLPRRASKFS